VYQDTVEIWARPLLMAQPGKALAFFCKTPFAACSTNQFVTYTMIDKEGILEKMQSSELFCSENLIKLLNDNYDFLWICSVIRSLFLFLNEL
jgi:hypothetical protein